MPLERTPNPRLRLRCGRVLLLLLLLLCLRGTGAAPEIPLDDTCSAEDSAATCGDDHEWCEKWSNEGECTSNPSYMGLHCARSCGVCPDQVPSHPSLTKEELDRGEDLGVAQDRGAEDPRVGARIRQARRYLEDTAGERRCSNGHASCAVWAVAGECEANPHAMKEACGPVCFSCDYADIEARCSWEPGDDDDDESAWGPGGLHAMYERIVADYETTTVLSSPATTNGPWLGALEDFLDEREAGEIIELAHKNGFEVFEDVEAMTAEVLPDHQNFPGSRTSTNAWCLHDECRRNATIVSYLDRITRIVGIRAQYAENFRILRYEEGQLNIIHHDFVPGEKYSRQGHRLFTFFAYLNDVERGGGTHFDQLGITVTPQRGRALIWPHVLNEAPDEIDERTTHQAFVVEKGIKYGIATTFHLRDYQTPNAEGCTGEYWTEKVRQNETLREEGRELRERSLQRMQQATREG